MYISRKKGSCATLFKPSFPLKREISRFRENTATPAGCDQDQLEETNVFTIPWYHLHHGGSGRVLWLLARVKMREQFFQDTSQWLRFRHYTRYWIVCLYVCVANLHFYKRALDEIRFENKIWWYENVDYDVTAQSYSLLIFY